MDKPKITILYDATEDEPQKPGEDVPVYREVARALDARGYSYRTLASGRDVWELVEPLRRDDADLVFNLCESLDGTDLHAIHVTALLELLGKRFTGSGSFGLTLAQDKSLAKKLFSFHGLSYPKFSIMNAGQVEWSDDLKFPLFVKPANTDSSVGIDEKALVKNIKELMERISFIHTELKTPVLIEEFIDGREIFCSVLGNDTVQALPIVEWDFSKVEKGAKFATAEAKWDKQSEGYRAPERFPTDIPESVYARVQSAAIDACRALKVLDYGRVDMRLRKRKKRGAAAHDDEAEDWEMSIIEVNPNPYLEESSELAMAANKQGIGYADLIEKIVGLALQRQR